MELSHCVLRMNQNLFKINVIIFKERNEKIVEKISTI